MIHQIDPLKDACWPTFQSETQFESITSLIVRTRRLSSPSPQSMLANV
jgi:hypothetical protein